MASSEAPILHDVAHAIAQGLNETHQAALEAHARSAHLREAEMRALEGKEDRLFDRYDGGEIDRPTYERQLIRVREEKPLWSRSTARRALGTARSTSSWQSAF